MLLEAGSFLDLLAGLWLSLTGLHFAWISFEKLDHHAKRVVGGRTFDLMKFQEKILESGSSTSVSVREESMKIRTPMSENSREFCPD